MKSKHTELFFREIFNIFRKTDEIESLGGYVHYNGHHNEIVEQLVAEWLIS